MPAKTPPRRTGKPSGSKLTLSIIVGMMLIPISAVAAVMLTTTALAAAAALPWSVPWNALLATALIATWWPQRA